MTRELKLALILGSSLVLVVGVLISDHLSGARDARIARVDPPLVAAPVEQMPPLTAGSPRTSPQPEPSLVQNVTPQDESFNHPQLALGDPVPQVAPQSMTADEQLAHAARQLGVELKPMDDLTATRIDSVDSPYEIVMGQPVVRDDAPANSASPTTSKPADAATTEYTIQSGDTLWKLATRFMGAGSRHTELAAMNKGRLGPDGELRVGTKILVPGAAANSTNTKQTQSAPKQTAAPKTYTVKSGDTLRKIAAKTLGSESRWKDLMDANKSVIKDPNALRAGAVLKIPSR